MKKIIFLGILFCFCFIYRSVYTEETRNNSYYEMLYKNAEELIKQGNEEKADFYLAKYMGVSLLDKITGKHFTDLNPLFEKYKVSKPISFISGQYSEDFMKWFVMSSYAQWGFDDDGDIDAKDQSFELVSNGDEKYFATIIGSPYLEGWYHMVGGKTKILVMALVDFKRKPFLTVGEHKNGVPKKMFDDIPLDIEGHPLQHIWPIEFHDLDNDGVSEIWLRYNKAWGSGFSQELAIYKIENNQLVLFKKFEGLAEGIARRLDDGRIEVAEGFSDTGNGHMGYEKHRIEIFECKDGNFVKLSERIVPHVLWTDDWQEYYFGE